MAAKIIPHNPPPHNPPPHNLEAEEATLGAILIRPQMFDEVVGLIEPTDFYREAHRKIYQAMLDLYSRHEPIDITLLNNLLKERGQFEEVGGPRFLMALSDNVGAPANAPNYARLVHEKAMCRRILTYCEEITSACSNPGASPADLLDFSESLLSEIRGAFKGNGLKSTEGAILEVADFLKTSHTMRKEYLKPWIWEAFIAMITAWRGVGKTSFLMGLLNSLSRGESFGPWETLVAVPCLYFDAEMTMQDTLERFQGLYSEKNERENLWVYSDHLSTSLGMPVANLIDEKWRAGMKEVLLQHGVKLWVLDNIGAVTPGLDENSREGWSPINRWLLDLRFAGISTILIHHEGKTGSQRGTSAREDNLDISISLKRPQGYRPDDGARFVCHFEKARIRQADLHLIADTEFQMLTDPEGKTVWTFANVKQENKAVVLKMLDEGIAAKDIAAGLGITAARVSQIKKEAVGEGLLTVNGKLTQTGVEWLQKT